MPRSTSAPRHQPLPWHRRLEARVAVGVTLLVALTLGSVLVATSRIVRTRALGSASVDLHAARDAFYHLIDSRAQFGAAQLRLVTELPIFRAYMQESPLAGDEASIGQMADGYRRSMGAAFLVVTNRAGTWTASPGWPASARPPAALVDEIAAAARGGAGRAIVTLRDGVYLSVTEPARFADEVLATVTAGFRLDDAVARELALTARCDVSLLGGGHLLGSSLGPAAHVTARNLLAADARALGAIGDPIILRTVGATRYVAGAFPVSPAGDRAGDAMLVLLQDWQPTQQSIDEVTRRLLAVGTVAFLLALACGVVVSRRITTPLSDITRITAEVAAGHWDHRVPVRGTDETAALALAFNDMTASLGHWRAEARSKASELQESYERFFAVAQSANDAIVSTDVNGRVVFWNRSAGRTFGYDETEALGQPFDAMLAVESRPVFLEHAARVQGRAAHLANMTAHGMVELTACRRGGDTFPVELSLATWTSGGAVNFTAIVRDITDRKRAEAALRAREEELRHAQKMEAVGRLAGGVAHDFNNLLTAIRGYAELLADDLGVHHPSRDDADQIVKAADSAGSLTRQLLAFSRKQILAPTVVSLADVVRGMEKILRRLIGEDVELVVAVPADVWTVRADAGQIEQVVMNLVVNARDAMPTGGRIDIQLENVVATQGRPGRGPLGECVAVSVRDTGQGMAPETLAHIFEPFFTTKAEGRGTGLGLAMVDGIIEQSGGLVLAESALGVGTTFRVLLPKVTAEYTAVQPPDGRPARGGSETVLVVEDEAGVRRLAYEVLTRAGYHVIQADRGDAALAEAARHPGPIHVLLSDVVMPAMSGRVLWERLSAVRPEMRVVFMSGYTDDAVVRHGILESKLPYLQKPFTAQALAAAVGNALASRRQDAA